MNIQPNFIGIPSGPYYVNHANGGLGAFRGGNYLPWPNATIANCTGYAFGKVAELHGWTWAESYRYFFDYRDAIGNPDQWYSTIRANEYLVKTGNTLTLPCMGIYGTSGTGHVNIIQGFDADGMLVMEESDYYAYGGSRYYKQIHCNATSSYAIYSDGSRNLSTDDTRNYRYNNGVLTMPSRYTLKGYIHLPKINVYDARITDKRKRRSSWFYNQ